MNKADYLKSLREAMSNAPEATVNDIIYDYSEHIDAALENGETESEIIEKLGAPERIAKLHGFQNSDEKKIGNGSKGKNQNTGRGTFGRILIFIGLFFFNLCIALGIFLGALGGLIGILAAGIGIGVAGIAAVFSPYIPEILNAAGNYVFTNAEQSFVTFLGIGLTCMGALITIGSIKLFQVFFKLGVRYFNWNIKVIKG